VALVLIGSVAASLLIPPEKDTPDIDVELPPGFDLHAGDDASGEGAEEAASETYQSRT
jgi:hypothetical protein